MQSTELLGKPQGQDLASGNLTAPAIYALQVRPHCVDATRCIALPLNAGANLQTAGQSLMQTEHQRCISPHVGRPTPVPSRAPISTNRRPLPLSPCPRTRWLAPACCS